jgi:TetR/AcrR family transcriptional regulator, cholesterol catabolism regulator
MPAKRDASTPKRKPAAADKGAAAPARPSTSTPRRKAADAAPKRTTAARKATGGDNGKPAARVGRPRSRERWLEKEREVVDIAAGVFAERGFHATSIEDLVEATGLQRGGLYHYMNGKADLLIKIHQRFIEPLLEQAHEVAAEDEPADVVLRKLAAVLMNDIATYRDQVTVFLHEWRVIEDDPEWKTIRKARKDFEGVIESVLRRGVDEGIFEIKDMRLAVMAFLGMFNHSYQWFQPGGRFSAQRIADNFCDIYISGVRA